MIVLKSSDPPQKNEISFTPFEAIITEYPWSKNREASFLDITNDREKLETISQTSLFDVSVVMWL